MLLSPSASNSMLCQPPMNTPREDSPAATTCSSTPSPSRSIVIIDLGTDQGSNSSVDTALTLVALIVLNVILPSIVEATPSETPEFGLIKSKSPSLSKSAIVELSKSICPWNEVRSHLLPSLILNAYPWSLSPTISISPSPSKSESISPCLISSNFVIGPPHIPLKSCQRVQWPVWSIIRAEIFPVPKKSSTYSVDKPAGIPAEPFIETDWLET